jgi:dethiobiotin synthetase
MQTHERPARLIAVMGTATDIGKTWASAALLMHARACQWRVAARKPAQSFDPASSAPTDAKTLAAASGDNAENVCLPHRWYPLAMAPPMAADRLQRPPLLLKELLAELSWPKDVRLGLVETAGGVRSPLAHDADCSEFARCLAPDDILLVADAGLGTINSVRLAMQVLSFAAVTVLLNRFDASDELHQLNRDWLASRDQLRVITDVREMLST